MPCIRAYVVHRCGIGSRFVGHVSSFLSGFKPIYAILSREICQSPALMTSRALPAPFLKALPFVPCWPVEVGPFSGYELSRGWQWCQPEQTKEETDYDNDDCNKTRRT
jgi:hypothetical protein